ncbi:MAG: hypothetical protein A3G41_08795 [Elusimicrobia bacterium RIFCSPLOWO2_12_FULL_59_9]|nr:MAG: hypothetical protein A3G41_08795 [Elusimicrobia bacterium RIFCSPLOWO2_12_FULL_59_9]
MLEPYLAYLDEGIVVMHPATGEIEMNPNMALWLGRRETRIKDILWPDFINHVFPVGDYKVLSSLKAQLPVFKSELVLYGKNQTAFPVQVTLLPDSHVTGHGQTCMIVKDVSSERKLNALK